MSESKSGYTIQGIHLIKSQFERYKYIPRDKLRNSFDLKISSELKGENIICDLTALLQIIDENDSPAVRFEVTYRGIFEKIGSTSLNSKAFANVNAPAIMFPYIREHITNISLKCGYNAVILPPFNFQAFYDEKKERESNAKDEDSQKE